MAAGVVAAALLARVISAMLFGVTTTDMATYLVALAAIGSSALLACLLPARRASRVPPATALRA